MSDWLKELDDVSATELLKGLQSKGLPTLKEGNYIRLSLKKEFRHGLDAVTQAALLEKIRRKRATDMEIPVYETIVSQSKQKDEVRKAIVLHRMGSTTLLSASGSRKTTRVMSAVSIIDLMELRDLQEKSPEFRFLLLKQIKAPVDHKEIKRTMGLSEEDEVMPNFLHNLLNSQRRGEEPHNQEAWRVLDVVRKTNLFMVYRKDKDITPVVDVRVIG